MQITMEVAKVALEQMGMTSRAAIEAVAKMSESPRAAARQFMIPIGETCDTAQIGRLEGGAVSFDVSDREAVEAESLQIGAEASFDVFISELDVINRTCKFVIRGEDDAKRYVGKIDDPTIGVPENQYVIALAKGNWLNVRAKPEISEGQISRLYISDSKI